MPLPASLRHEAAGKDAATASLIEASVASLSALSSSATMTTTEVSPSWAPDCALGPLWPFLEVRALSGSIVGEAVARGADSAESLPGLDFCAGVVEAGEQLATASAHADTRGSMRRGPRALAVSVPGPRPRESANQ